MSTKCATKHLPFTGILNQGEESDLPLHGGGQGFESPRLHKGKVLLTADPEFNKNGLPFDLGAFDLDGTVLRRDLVISARTTAAIRRLRERGMRLVVATERRFEGGPGNMLRGWVSQVRTP